MTGVRASFSKLNLRARVTLGILLPLVMILLVLNLVEYQRNQAVVFSNLSTLAAHSTTVIELNLRQQMLDSDFEEIQDLLDSFGSSDQFRIIYLLDASGQVIFAPHSQGVGNKLSNTAPDCQPCHRLPPDQRPYSLVVQANDGQRVFRSMSPINNSAECAPCHGTQDRYIGLLLTDIPVAPLEQPMKEHLRASLVWWAVAIAVIVIVINAGMDRLVFHRLQALAAALNRFGQDQTTLPLETGSRDEIGQLSLAFSSMTDQVQARNAENQALSERLQRQNTQRGELLRQLITVQEDERKRLARELHDELGQALSGLSLRAEAIQRWLNTDAARASEELRGVQSLIKATTDQMYDLIFTLRPSILDDLGLPAAVRAHADRLLKGTGIDFRLEEVDLSRRLSPETETTLYRIFQEALNNIIRHSQATAVHVRLYCTPEALVAEISDNGVGFQPEHHRHDGQQNGGWGLLGIQERLALLGGQLEVDSQPQQGARLRVHIPILESDCD